MAYTMATNRHITPKPGQGWRVWAEWWALVSWLPAWVGQNSVTGFRHESGSAWAIAGRTNRTAIMQAMAAAGRRSKVPAATLSTARAVRYSPGPGVRAGHGCGRRPGGAPGPDGGIGLPAAGGQLGRPGAADVYRPPGTGP